MDGRSQAAERSKAASYGVQEEGPERALKLTSSSLRRRHREAMGHQDNTDDKKELGSELRQNR